jgi:class 3 adenylate cyclase/tetratricopeptide (TPR) repeat protein
VNDEASRPGPVRVEREERRVVTALFADLVGSTELTERFDPEDAREVLGGAIERMIEIVDNLGGTIKDLAGDGVLVLFGAPVAHEDDAERAVLAGLRIVSAVADYADDAVRRYKCERFAARVGIESGPAVVGAVGAGSRIEYGAVGDVVNSASRLQSSAEPGTVLVGETTRASADRWFEWGPLVSLSLKGKSTPVGASVAIRHAQPPEAPALASVTIGRAKELALLEAALGDLRSDRGALVLLSGAAGVGKTRLLAETRAMLSGIGTTSEKVCWLEGHCRSYADTIPYALYQDLLCRWLGVRADDSPARKRGVLASALPRLASGDDDECKALLAHVLGVTEGSVGSIAPAELQRRAFGALLSLVRRIAHDTVLVVALEDLQWADPTSLALTEQLVTLPDSDPLLVIATRRAEEEDASSQLFERAVRRGHGTLLQLGPLPSGGDREFVRALVGSALPDEVERSIFAVSEGNPFFLEQQVKALVDGGAVTRRAEGWRFDGDDNTQIPETIEKVILSRLDRLEPTTRQTLVAASVLGRAFGSEPLGALVDDASSLASDLDALVRVGLVDRVASGSTADYRFAHAVIQETAYQSLLRRTRRALHGRAAATLEQLRADRTDSVAATIGHHFAEAGEVDRAIPFFVTAGDRAKAAYANEESIVSYRRAAGLIEDRGDGVGEDPALHSDLLARLGDVLRLVGDHDEARDIFERALASLPAGDRFRSADLQLQLGRVEDELHRYERALEHWACAESDLSDVPEDAPGRWDKWFDIQDHKMTTLYWLGDTETIDSLAKRIRPLVETRGSLAQRGEFFGRLAQARLRRNRYIADHDTVEFARAAFDAVLEDGKRDAIAWRHFLLGFVLLLADELDEAEALLHDALSEAEQMGDARLRSRCLTYLLVSGRRRGDVERVRHELSGVIEAARVAHLPEYEAIAIANDAWLAWRDGDAVTTLARGRAALDLWETLPVRYWFDWMALWPMTAVACAQGDIATAINNFRAMLAEPQQPLSRPLVDMVERAVTTWKRGTRSAAEQLVAHALDVAEELSYL